VFAAALSITLAQIVAASGSTARGDSIYASQTVRDIVAAAATNNRTPPPEFRGYEARVETELSLIVRDTLGRERAAQIEQLASTARWGGMGEYNLHVVGYRSQSVGVPYSALSIVRGWTIPSLYGERLRLGASFGPARAGDTRDQIIAVHPFARDRDEYYHFAGGDTVTVLRAGDRSIPIVRIRVTPRVTSGRRLGLFDGEIDLDANRLQIVRMRGRFVAFGGRPTGGSIRSRMPGLTAVAYGEFVNAEVGGRYWLPAFQRTEFQATIALFGQTRSVFRLVSRFADFAVDTGAALSDSTTPRIRVTYSSGDSMSRYREWRQELGVATASVTADDFDDVGPDAWRPGGPPRLDLVPVRTSEMIRFNRVEGFYTGLAATVQFRDQIPGLSVGGFGGWAWTEKTVRGGVRASLKRGLSTFSARAERSLDRTNDFELPLDDGGGIGALLGSIDDNDYVDRTAAVLSATRLMGGIDVGLVTAQLGVAHDRSERSRLSHGVFGSSTAFRPNRGVASGSYAFAMADLELRPNVTGDFVQPGVGARLHYEGAAGDLRWQRIELGLSTRHFWGPLSIGAHADGGLLVASAPPPQTLFELGGYETLPGYDYKAFAGDRAALFRTFASLRFPIWRTPVRLIRNLYIPGVGPGLGVSAQGGWTEISSAATQRSVDALGAGWSVEPVSVATGGMRASVGAGITLFSDIVHVGFARPVDHSAPWRFVAGFGPSF
jgi:hypothetical protein